MTRQFSRFVICAILVFGLQGCGERKQEAAEQPVRGLRAYKVAAKAESRASPLSQRAAARGCQQPLLRDRRATEGRHPHRRPKSATGRRAGGNRPALAAERRSNRPAPACSRHRRSSTTRKAIFSARKNCLKRGVATQAVFDQSRATLLSSRAQLDQARRQLELANHNLDRSKLLAPFSGTIARVEVKSFAQVAAGQPIVTLYSDDRFEMSFLAPSPTFQSLKVGQSVDVKIADMPDLLAQGRDQGAGVQSRAGLGLSGGRPAGQQRPRFERGHVRGSQRSRNL